MDTFLSYRTRIARHLDSYAKVRSITCRMAFLALGVSFSSPVRRMCPRYPYAATGEYHGARLAGDRLASGRYETIDVAEVAVGVLEGYSAALNVYWRW